MYINTVTNQYPVSEAEIRAAFPNTSFPFPFQAPAEYKVVFPAPQPDYDPMTKYVVEAAPIETIKGHWEQAWQVKNLTAAQKTAKKQELLERLQQEALVNVQARLDAFAKTKGYDSMLSACSYATSKNPVRAAEGQYCVDARDATWDTLYQYQADVLAGTVTAPTSYADIEAILPTLAWPAN